MFLNNCIGCHSGMDPMAQAFAYYDYDETAGSMRLHAGRRAAEVLQQQGHVPGRLLDAGRQLGQLLAQGPNSLLGWDGALPGRGSGAKSLGRELAHSDAFAALPGREGLPQRLLPRAERCAGSRRGAGDDRESFKSSGYQLKRVFAEAATYCMGD